jgi:hypothetical protein
MISFSYLPKRCRFGPLRLTLLVVKGEIMHEKIWKFRVSHGETDCASYFRKKASELAAALNHKLIATSEIEVGPEIGIRTVSGVALIDSQPRIRRKSGRRPKRLDCSRKLENTGNPLA